MQLIDEGLTYDNNLEHILSITRNGYFAMVSWGDLFPVLQNLNLRAKGRLLALGFAADYVFTLERIYHFLL